MLLINISLFYSYLVCSLLEDILVGETSLYRFKRYLYSLIQYVVYFSAF